MWGGREHRTRLWLKYRICLWQSKNQLESSERRTKACISSPWSNSSRNFSCLRNVMDNKRCRFHHGRLFLDWRGSYDILSLAAGETTILTFLINDTVLDLASIVYSYFCQRIPIQTALASSLYEINSREGLEMKTKMRTILTYPVRTENLSIAGTL